MTNLESCPHCGADLRGEEIPTEFRRDYRMTHYMRTIGVEVLGVYDGVLFWACPDCRQGWHRWDQASYPRRYAAAEEHMRRWALAREEEP